jgi:hypothetical protein
VAIILREARRHIDNRLTFVIWLDDTKLDLLGSDPTLPDPRYLLAVERQVPPSWAGRPNAERTAYLGSLRTELRTLADARLAQIADEDSNGTVLPIEGATL